MLKSRCLLSTLGLSKTVNILEGKITAANHAFACSRRNYCDPPKPARNPGFKPGTDLEQYLEKEGKYEANQVIEYISKYAQQKNKETFLHAIAMYTEKNKVYQRGSVEFILASLIKLQAYDVHKDLEVYKELLGIFPEGKYVHKNVLQAEFMHYPKQQEAAIQVLIKMYRNQVIPDDEMGQMIVDRFGKWSHVMKRYKRQMYWAPKMKSFSPYYVPWELTGDDPYRLARLALKRMSVDSTTRIEVKHTKQLESAEDKTFVAYSISHFQSELIGELPRDKPIFVEGGFTTWLNEHRVTYFILRADLPEDLQFISPYDGKDFYKTMDNYLGSNSGERDGVLSQALSCHVQPEGIILSMCVTGSSSKESLNSYITYLQEEVPSLVGIPVVFSLRTPDARIATGHEDIDEDGRRELIPSPRIKLGALPKK